MKILTHAEDCPDPKSDDPLKCNCAGDFKKFDTLDDALADGFDFDCACCGKMIDDDYTFDADPIVVLHPWGEIHQVFCSPRCKQHGLG